MTISSVEAPTHAEPARGAVSPSLRGGPIASARRLLPLALLCLGLRKIVTDSFIPGWQPLAPSAHYPVLAMIDALALFGLSMAALVEPRRAVSYPYWGLAALMSLWVIVLQLPGLLAKPTVVVLWLGVAEVGALVAASILAAQSTLSGDSAARRWWLAVSFAAFGASCVVFGISHFAYVEFTSQMIPAWIPARMPLAYFTGAAHIAAGLAIATGILRRLAALSLSFMMAAFVALVHIPALWASHGSLEQITFLLNACALCGSALIAASISGLRLSRPPA